MTGVGHTVAEKVWYRTLTTKLTSSSGYAAARNGAIASAKELYGKNSANCAGGAERLQRHRGARRHPDLRQLTQVTGRGDVLVAETRASPRTVSGPQRQTVRWSGGSCTSSSSARAVVDSGSLPWASPRSTAPPSRSHARDRHPVGAGRRGDRGRRGGGQGLHRLAPAPRSRPRRAGRAGDPAVGATAAGRRSRPCPRCGAGASRMPCRPVPRRRRRPPCRPGSRCGEDCCPQAPVGQRRRRGPRRRRRQRRVGAR